jgi:hypothetical protein
MQKINLAVEAFKYYPYNLSCSLNIFWTFMKKLWISLGLVGFILPVKSFAINESYQDQISCKNWRVQLKEPMQFPPFVKTAAFKQEFQHTKSSDEDEGDYYVDIYKPRKPQQLYMANIRSVTTDAGYGGMWTSAGFEVELNGQLQNILKQAQQHLNVQQWSQINRTVQQYNDQGEVVKSAKTTEYYAMQFYPHQARTVIISQDPFSKNIHINCRAIEGDIKQYRDDFKSF